MSNTTKKGRLDDYISQAEAARIRGVTIQAIANLIKRAKLTGYEIGGRTFVRRSEVEAFVPLPLGRPPKKTAAAKTPKKLISRKKN